MRSYIVILFALSAFSPIAWATADGADCFRVIGVAAQDMLNIRSVPNVRANIMGKIPANAIVKNMSSASDVECPDTIEKNMPPECRTGNPWHKIEYKGVTGWARSKFLEASDDCP